MFKHRWLEAAAAMLACSGAAHATEVAVCTDEGRFVIDLADAKAPKHVENFLRYVDMGFYTGTVFHRVAPSFVVQGGGVDRKLRRKPTLPPVENESRNGLSNERGTVAAARTEDPNSANSQFFVNLVDNERLDAGDELGYTVFGRVTEGIEVLDRISRLPTGASGPFESQVPTPLVAIRSATRFDAAALAAVPEDQRDTALRERVDTAAAAQDPLATLEAVNLYRAACGSPDPEVSLVEAKAALDANERRKAVFVLEDYFATTNEDDPGYAQALELYRNAVQEHEQSAAQIADDCVPPTPPAIADGGTASRDEMLAGQTLVKQFVAAGDAYIACLARIIDNTERAPAERNAATAEHNRMVSAMEQAAADFNAQIRIFKGRGL
jgi:cyclophilin family peptidyl-prolyl cis-trans isomerase